MASTRARVAADALPEGRVTRSQAAQLPSGKRGGAEEDAAKARTGPNLEFWEGGNPGSFSATQAVCGSGGRRAAGAKKRAALCDLTNGGAAAVRLGAGRAKVAEADADDGAKGASRRRSHDLAQPQSHTESAVVLEALRRQPRAPPAAGFGATAPPLAAGAPLADGAEPMDADGGVHLAQQAPDAPATPPEWKDVDAAHAEDPLFVGAYVGDIYRYLRVAELKHRPSTRYMDNVQVDINSTMRGILVDWLVEVAEEYKLVPDTLFLSVAYIDRCLSAHVVQRAQLQLVGVTCMLIAAKYEEIYAPQVDEFCYITDNTYTREQVLAMERKVLDTLSFELTTPTAKSFLRRFLRAAEADQKAEFLACFLAELSLLDYTFLRFTPSTVAASCVLVAQWALRRPAWSPTLAHYAGYSPAQLRECATALAELLAGARRSSLPAVREKYSQHKFKCVACVVPPEGGIPDAVWEM